MFDKTFDINHPALYLIAGVVILFVLGQSVFFLIQALKRAKELGISKSAIRKTITSSAVFTVPTALSILATVISLTKALGMVIPWVRLSVIGNLVYEFQAASNAIDTFDKLGFDVSGMTEAITDPQVFTGVIWIMTFGIIMPLVLSPILVKPISKKVGSITQKKDKPAKHSDSKKKFDIAGLIDYISPAVFIGLIGAFVARAIAGQGEPNVFGDGAGILSVITLATAILVSSVLEILCKKFKWTKFEPFIMPIGMIVAMAVAIIAFNFILDPSIREFEWRG